MNSHNEKPFQRPPARARWLWGALILAFFACWAADLTVGSVQIPIREIFRALTGAENLPRNWSVIVRDYRFPKSITALLSGAALSVAGLQMQTLFHNPLADPFILGISSGANLGAALVILTGIGGGFQSIGSLDLTGSVGLILAAAIGSLLVFIPVILLAHSVHPATLLISGVFVGSIVNAFVRILVQYATPDAIQAYLSWTFGSFSGVTGNQLRIFAPVVLGGLALSALTIKPLNAFLLGDQQARSVGIDPRRARRLTIAVASVLTGVVTAHCGIIGFIGIAIPHFCRSVFADSDHKVLLPACILAGSCVALIADMISQSFGGTYLLPINSVTALVGGPVILAVILNKRSLSRDF